MGLFGVMTNIFLFPLSLFTSPGSGDHSSHCSLTGVFTTFLFVEEKAQHESLTFKPYESLEQRCEHFVPNTSKPPQLSTAVAFPKLSKLCFQADFWLLSIHAQAEEQKEGKPPA